MEPMTNPQPEMEVSELARLAASDNYGAVHSVYGVIAIDRHTRRIEQAINQSTAPLREEIESLKAIQAGYEQGSRMNEMLLRNQITQLEKQVLETQNAYQTVKEWGHRLEAQIIHFLNEFDAHADGAPDATPLGKFCNEMIGLYNNISLGKVHSLQQQLTTKREVLEKCVEAMLLDSVNRGDCERFGIDFEKHRCGCEACERSTQLCTATQSSIIMEIREKALTLANEELKKEQGLVGQQ